MDAGTLIGAGAAALTSLSYIPQLLKAREPGSTHDLSWKTLTVLTAGLSLWVIYGLDRSDYVLVAANLVGAGLSCAVLACKIRDMVRPPASMK